MPRQTEREARGGDVHPRPGIRWQLAPDFGGIYAPLS